MITNEAHHADELLAECAAKAAALERQLEIEKTRADLLLGLHALGVGDDVAELEKLTAACIELQTQIEDLSRRRRAIAVAAHHLRANELRQEAERLGEELEEAQRQLRDEFPDAVDLERAESRAAVAKIAVQTGIGLSHTETIAAQTSPVTRERIAAYREDREKIGQMQDHLASISQALDKIRSRYPGALAAVVMDR